MPKIVKPKLPLPAPSHYLPPDFVLKIPTLAELMERTNFKGKHGKIKRPPNAFFLVRSELQRQLDPKTVKSAASLEPFEDVMSMASSPGDEDGESVVSQEGDVDDIPKKGDAIVQSVVSRLSSVVWNRMSLKQKTPWNQLARDVKVAHALKFPGYKYKPSNNPNRKRKSKLPQAVCEDDDEYDEDALTSKTKDGCKDMTPRLFFTSTLGTRERPFAVPSQRRAFVLHDTSPAQAGVSYVYQTNPIRMLPFPSLKSDGRYTSGHNFNADSPAPGASAQFQNISEEQAQYLNQLIALDVANRNTNVMQQPWEGVADLRGNPYIGHLQNHVARPVATTTAVESSRDLTSQPMTATSARSATVTGRTAGSDTSSEATPMLSPLDSFLSFTASSTMSTSSHNTANQIQTPVANYGALNYGTGTSGQNMVFPDWWDNGMTNSNLNNLPLPPFPMLTTAGMDANMNMYNNAAHNTLDLNTPFFDYAAIDPQLTGAGPPPVEPQTQENTFAHDSSHSQDLNDMWAAEAANMSYNTNLDESQYYTGFYADPPGQQFDQTSIPHFQGLSSGFTTPNSQTRLDAEPQKFNTSARGGDFTPTLHDRSSALREAWASGSKMAANGWGF